MKKSKDTRTTNKYTNKRRGGTNHANVRTVCPITQKQIYELENVYQTCLDITKYDADALAEYVFKHEQCKFPTSRAVIPVADVYRLFQNVKGSNKYTLTDLKKAMDISIAKQQELKDSLIEEAKLYNTTVNLPRNLQSPRSNSPRSNSQSSNSENECVEYKNSDGSETTYCKSEGVKYQEESTGDYYEYNSLMNNDDHSDFTKIMKNLLKRFFNKDPDLIETNSSSRRNLNDLNLNSMYAPIAISIDPRSKSLWLHMLVQYTDSNNNIKVAIIELNGTALNNNSKYTVHKLDADYKYAKVYFDGHNSIDYLFVTDNGEYDMRARNDDKANERYNTSSHEKFKACNYWLYKNDMYDKLTLDKMNDLDNWIAWIKWEETSGGGRRKHAPKHKNSKGTKTSVPKKKTKYVRTTKQYKSRDGVRYIVLEKDSKYYIKKKNKEGKFIYRMVNIN